MRRDEIERVIDAGRDATVALIAAQAEQIALLRAEVEELKRLIGRDSSNSSLPPSRDSPAARTKRAGKRKPSGRRQGGQPGHPGRHRPLVADPDRVVAHWPRACGGCQRPLGEQSPVAGEPVRHQVTELVMHAEVTEHRRMRVCCPGCGQRTLAELPAGVPAGAFGPGVQAAAATLTAARVSRRDTARLLADLCGVQASTASVEALVKRTSGLLEDPYVEILHAVDGEPVRCVDETSWRQAGQGRWVAVAAAKGAALFQIGERRDRDSIRALLGDAPAGTIVSDRYAAYLHIPDAQRQLCLAHVLRDLIALSERDGPPGRLGEQLARCLSDVFKTINQPGRDPRDLAALAADAQPLRDRLAALLEHGTRGRDQRTARFCQNLLDHEGALWTFTRVADVPSTNNTAERALRHAVLWRKTSYGTQTDHGDRAVERLLTIRETCRLQRRRLTRYLIDVISAGLRDRPIPAPLST